MQLRDYQTTAKNFLIQHPKSGLFLDVGFGKTLTTLSALMELAQTNQISGHILVIAPKAIARSTWIDEMKKWGIKASCVSLITNDKGKQLTKKERLELYEQIATQRPSFYFINREMIKNLVDWHTDTHRPNVFIKKWPFPTIVVDELQSFKSYSSKRFQALKRVYPFTKRFIGLTGTPVPNGLMDLWPEIYLMDGGYRLGPNITAYRNKYFYPGLTIDDNVVSWWPKRNSEKIIYDKIKDIVISVKNPDLKLPPITYNDVYCELSSDERGIYTNVMERCIYEYIDSDGDIQKIKIKNAAVLFAKLSQMASGTIYLKDNTEYAIIHERKLEQLEYLINNTTSPVIIAYHFKSDKQQIETYLADKGLKVRTLDGSPEMIHEWNQGKIPIMLLQPAAVGHGINIQDGGHTLIWYTVPTSLEEYIQACGRVYRQGQKYPVVIHHLLCKQTIDTKIMNNIIKKDTSEKALLEAISVTIQENMKK